jgi:hypothetical protein
MTKMRGITLSTNTTLKTGVKKNRFRGSFLFLYDFYKILFTVF